MNKIDNHLCKKAKIFTGTLVKNIKSTVKLHLEFEGIKQLKTNSKQLIEI